MTNKPVLHPKDPPTAPEQDQPMQKRPIDEESKQYSILTITS